MAYKIEITATADAEADEAYHWIAAREPTAAIKWYRGLLAKIGTLAENPERCPLAAESPAFPFDLRELLYGRRRGVYRILYTVSGDRVRIMRIRHAARRNLNE